MGDWVSCAHLNEICFRYSARIYELRQSGLTIHKEKRGKDGLWHYKLMTRLEDIDRDNACLTKEAMIDQGEQLRML
jgi:hypothetical protein